MDKTIGTGMYELRHEPSQKDNPDGDPVDVWLRFEDGTEQEGYYDPRASVAGGKFYVEQDGHPIDCAVLQKLPTHWMYRLDNVIKK